MVLVNHKVTSKFRAATSRLVHIIVTQTPISTSSQDLAALSAKSLKTQTKKAQTLKWAAEALALKG